jgi:hypothetical protein
MNALLARDLHTALMFYNVVGYCLMSICSAAAAALLEPVLAVARLAVLALALPAPVLAVTRAAVPALVLPAPVLAQSFLRWAGRSYSKPCTCYCKTQRSSCRRLHCRVYTPPPQPSGWWQCRDQTKGCCDIEWLWASGSKRNLVLAPPLRGGLRAAPAPTPPGGWSSERPRGGGR